MEHVLTDKPAVSAACGEHKTEEHAPADKPTASAACGNSRFCCFTNRVRRALRRGEHKLSGRFAYGEHKAGEHAPYERPINSTVCDSDKFHRSAIQVRVLSAKARPMARKRGSICLLTS